MAAACWFVWRDDEVEVRGLKFQRFFCFHLRMTPNKSCRNKSPRLINTLQTIIITTENALILHRYSKRLKLNSMPHSSPSPTNSSPSPANKSQSSAINKSHT